MNNYDTNEYLGMMFADLLGIFTCLMGWKWVVNPATKESLGPVFYVWMVVILVIASILICTLFTGQPVRRVFLCVIVMSLN